MNTLIFNWKPLFWGTKTRIVRPEEQHNLEKIKRYLRDTLTEGVNKFISFADLINNPRLRTPQNVFAIIERILELFNSVDADLWETSSIPVKIFTKKYSNQSLIWILWTDIEKYKNNPDLLLQDLGIIDAYYKRSNHIKIINDTASPVTTKIMEKFHEAFEVVMRNGIKKDDTYSYIQFDEFTINKDGNVAFSKNAKPITIRKKDIVYNIQQVLDDINLIER